MLDALSQWELGILHGLDRLATPFLDAFWTLVTYFGEAGIFWIALSLALLIPRKTRKVGLSMALALLIGVVLGNGVLKNLCARARPYDLDPTLSPRLAWGKMTTDFSFPSGHTMASFEGATVLAIHTRKWALPALALASLVAVSRLFLVVHYPSDVLVGAILGAAFAFFAAFLVDRLWKKQEQKNVGC